MESVALPLFVASSIFLLVSVLMFVFASKKERASQTLLAKPRDPVPDLTAQDLLHDLTKRGSAIIKVDVIDPSNLLLRSPRR